MKTNDVLGLLIVVFIVIFLFRGLTQSKSSFWDLISFKSIQTPDLVDPIDLRLRQDRDVTQQPRFDSSTNLERCPNSVLNSLAARNVQYESENGSTTLEGMIYGLVRCNGSAIAQTYPDPLVVGLFPALSRPDFSGNYKKLTTPALQTTLCNSGTSDTCYRFDDITPGDYTVLVDRGSGWYCDSGTCRVSIQSGSTTVFDMVTDR